MTRNLFARALPFLAIPLAVFLGSATGFSTRAQARQATPPPSAGERIAAASSTPRPASRPAPPFGIQVVDGETSRGIPGIELRTTNDILFMTDSAGWVAFDEPGLLGARVFFSIKGDGYEYPHEVFGVRGAGIDTKSGGSTTLRMRRVNIAERLYRITGGGIYRDSVLLGNPVPLSNPVLNGKVFGQDSTIAVPYRGRIYWFWGDTSRPEGPLGHFGMAGAVSELPENGGLDPSSGVELDYFVGKDGFSRPMVDVAGEGMKWVGGAFTVRDAAGRDRMVGRLDRMKSLGEKLGAHLVVYDDDKDAFVELAKWDKDSQLGPAGQAFRHTVDGREYVYFAVPLGTLRVPADWDSVRDLTKYETFTCFERGAKWDEKSPPPIERDPTTRKVVWGWKANTDAPTLAQQADLVKHGRLRAEELWNNPQDVDSPTTRTVLLWAGSVRWNAWRGKWICIANEGFGAPSMLGEVWLGEADAPEGPWRRVKKIVTHEKYDFYNPVQHAFFDQQGGRLIYFEGTYSNTFSGATYVKPRYTYNQIMYRLDLGSPRLANLFAHGRH